MSDAARLGAAVLQELREASDPQRAVNERRYLRSHRNHLGAGMPAVETVVRRLKKEDLSHDELLDLIEAMWDTGIFECCMVAAKVAKLEAKKLSPGDLFVFEQMLRESDGWALVDTISTGVVGSIVAAHPSETGGVLDRWAVDDDFWVRRAAMLALLKPLSRGEGDWTRFARYADPMLEEKEFFIRKAIGWILRETSKKRPALVTSWLEPRVTRCSGVTFREAVKYLPDSDRERLISERSNG